MRGHKALGALCVLGACLLSAAGAQASPETYPLERVRAGQTVAHLAPAPVAEVIANNGLYL